MPGIHMKRRMLLLAVAVTTLMVIVSLKLLFPKGKDEFKQWQIIMKDRPYLPMNYVYQEKPKKPEIFRPGLEVNFFAQILLKSYMTYADVENNFFKYLETKSVLCEDNRRLGNQHDGGWNVCLSPPFNLSVKQPCLVYAFGIGNDWRFEDDMYDLFRCRVMAYDPSINLREHNRTIGIFFKPEGLGVRNYKTDDGWKLKTFKHFLNDEGDIEHVIDYFKFDVEFMEWDILQSLVLDDSLYNVKQLAFEIHLKHPTRTESSNLYITKKEFVSKFKILSLLEDMNFKLFDYRMNPFCSYVSNVTHLARSRCYELHYLNMKFVEPRHLKNRRDERFGILA